MTIVSVSVLNNVRLIKYVHLKEEAWLLNRDVVNRTKWEEVTTSNVGISSYGWLMHQKF